MTILEEIFLKVEEEKDLQEVHSLISSVESSLTTKQRVDLVIKGSKARHKRIEKLKELELRNLKGNTKSSRGLMRRFRNEKKKGEAEMMTYQQLVNLKEELKDQEDSPKDKTCFMSHESSLISAQIAVNELLEQLEKGDKIPLEKLITLFGLVGIPISHDVQNYTDPMNIGIDSGLKAVVPSNQCHLSQRSLWGLSGTNHNESLGQSFGFNSKITAVVPIKSWNHPVVWNAFQKKTTLGKYLLSAQLRGTDTPIPSDHVAFTTSTLMRALQQWPEPNESEASLMADLLDTIQFKNHNREVLKEFMEKSDFHIISNMASGLAPIAKMMESAEVLSFAGSAGSKQFWRAIYSNSIFWKIKRSVGKHKEDRSNRMKAIINTDTKTINQEELEKYMLDPTVYAQTHQIAKKFTAFPKIGAEMFQNNQANVEEFKRVVASYNFNLFMAVEVTKALLCKKSTWRLKTHKFPHFNSEEDAWLWLQQVHATLECNKVLKPRTDGTVKDFFKSVCTLSLSEFASQLNDIIPCEFDKFQPDTKRTSKFMIEEVLDQLTLQGGVQVEEKLRLLLFGQDADFQWQNGHCLRNSVIAKRILGALTPYMTEEGSNKQELDTLHSKLDKMTKHYYRTKGSRRKYSNDKPSFWTITGHTEPWSFMKQSRQEYLKFKDTLASFHNSGEPPKEQFFKEWNHLLKHDPSKNDTSGREAKRLSDEHPNRFKTVAKLAHAVAKFKEKIQHKENRRLLAVFPHPKDTSFGLKDLMAKMEISKEDVKVTEARDKNAACNWEKVLTGMIPEDKSKGMVLSIKEIFGLNEIKFMANTAYNMMKEMPDIHGKRNELIKVLNSAMSTDSGETVLENDCEVDDFELFLTNDQMKVFQKHYIRILERLLPLSAYEPRTAIETAFSSQVKRMAATYHILQRDMDYGHTTMTSLVRLLNKEELVNSTEHILEGSEELSLVDPRVAFELKYDMNGKSNDKEIRKSLEDGLTAVQTNENLILWLNQEYKKKCGANNWDPLENEVTKAELEKLRVSVEDIWFGSYYHEKVMIDFNYDNFDNDEAVGDGQKHRLNQLKNFFHLALENMYQIVPTEGEFIFKTDTWEVFQKIDDPNERVKALELKVKALWNGMELHEEMREEAASIFSTLHDKGVHYNTAQKIVDLLKTDKNDIDNITIRIQETDTTPGNRVTVIDSGPIFIHPERKHRFKDLPQNLYVKVLELMNNELLKRTLFKEYIDRIIYINTPMLFDLKDRAELSDNIKLMSDSPRAKLQKILDSYREFNGTFGGLMEVFDAIKNKYPEEDETQEAMTKLLDGLDVIMQEARELSKKQAPKQYSDKKTVESFMSFLDTHKHDGMNKYANLYGMTKAQFLKLAEDKVVIPGDMIFFFRKAYGVEYTHAGIYIPTITEKRVVHIQPVKGQVMWSLASTIQIHDLEKVINKTDKVFYVRACQTRKDQKGVLERIHACVTPEPITYKYHGYFGSCQTFCGKIFAMQALKDLNPEAFLASSGMLKTLAGKFLGTEDSALALCRLMDARFASPQRTEVDLGDGEDLVKTCPENYIRRNR